jgi:hypothetical protein
LGEPILKFYLEVENNFQGNLNNLAVFFCVHRVTDVFNDEREIKSDDIFLFYNNTFYLLKSIITNYEQEVIFRKGGYGFEFDFSSKEASIFFEVRGGIGALPLHGISFPENKWQKINLCLEFVKDPTEMEQGENNIIGEKVPINLNFVERDHDKLLIPLKDFRSSLEDSGKDYSVFSSIFSGDQVVLKNDCYKLT